MKKTSLIALAILATQFTGCSRKSETNQTQPIVEANTNQTATADATATHQALATVEAKTTNQIATPGVTAISPPPQEAYRILKKEDGIQFAVHGGLSQGVPGQMTHIIAAFVLVDSGGKFIDVELTDHTFTDDSMFINTKMFGPISVISERDDTYGATETQIKKIHEFLATQAKSSATPSK